MTIERIINENITKFKKDADLIVQRETSYITSELTSDLRKLIVLIEFIKKCQKPIIYIKKPSARFLKYKNELQDVVDFLSMSGCEIQFVFDDYSRRNEFREWTKINLNQPGITVRHLDNSFMRSSNTKSFVVSNLGITTWDIDLIAYDMLNTSYQLLLAYNKIEVTKNSKISTRIKYIEYESSIFRY